MAMVGSSHIDKVACGDTFTVALSKGRRGLNIYIGLILYSSTSIVRLLLVQRFGSIGIQLFFLYLHGLRFIKKVVCNL